MSYLTVYEIKLIHDSCTQCHGLNHCAGGPWSSCSELRFVWCFHLSFVDCSFLSLVLGVNQHTSVEVPPHQGHQTSRSPPDSAVRITVLLSSSCHTQKGLAIKTKLAQFLTAECCVHAQATSWSVYCHARTYQGYRLVITKLHGSMILHCTLKPWWVWIIHWKFGKWGSQQCPKQTLSNIYQYFCTYIPSGRLELLVYVIKTFFWTNCMLHVQKYRNEHKTEYGRWTHFSGDQSV